MPDDRDAATEAVRDGPLYDVNYFAHYKVPYTDEGWAGFFGRVADELVRSIAPATALDAGCAMGWLVEALRARSVDAYGIDISEYAIANARIAARPYCRVASVTDPLPQRYDLICCIEVLEHLTPLDAMRAVENLCAHADDIVFTSTPDDFAEETHVNIRPQEYWTELFAGQDFYRDMDFEAPYLASWAARYRRRRDTIPRVIAAYDRELWRHRVETRERNQLVERQLRQITVLRQQGEENQALREQIEQLQQQLVEAGHDTERARRDLETLRASAAGRLALGMQETALRLAPAHSLRGRALHEMAHASATLVSDGRSLDGRRRRRQITGAVTAPGVETVPDGRSAATAAPDSQAEYQLWLRQHTPDERALRLLRRENLRWTERPLVSVIVPVFEPGLVYLEEALASVLAQVYPVWELCIADDGSSDVRVHDVLRRMAAIDPRVKVVFRERNGGIAAASNSALQRATGEFVTFLDHDDVLRPQALHALVAHVNAHPRTDVVYSDEDKLLPSGDYGEVFFKPDWSPDFLRSSNYINHLTMIRRALVTDVGGFREDLDGAQDHDLFLRVTERAARVGHVADVLYAWRKALGSVALSTAAKSTAHIAGGKAVDDALRRTGERGTVTAYPENFYRVRYALDDTADVAVIIDASRSPDTLQRCLESLDEHPAYANRSVVILDDAALPDALREQCEAQQHRVIRGAPAARAAALNWAVGMTEASHLLFLDPSFIVTNDGWIERLLEHGQRLGVGAVGARLLQLDGHVEHEGVMCRGPELARSVETGWPFLVREVSGVSAACMLTSRHRFDDAGGFDERYTTMLHDVDYCLRVRERGYRVLFTPWTELRRMVPGGGLDWNVAPEDAAADRRRFGDRWGSAETIADPYVNPNVVQPCPLRLRIA